MYMPNYKITPKIAKDISIISAAREVILNSPILPKIESRLKRNALLSRSHHSTSIEGNPLSQEQVAIIAAGGKITARPKDKKEVLNYISTLKFVDKHGKNIKQITPKIVLKLHQLISKEIINANQSGKFRDKMVYVVDGFGRTVFTPPSQRQVPRLVNSLCQWLNQKETKELYPVLTAGIAHYEFVRIHPFIDGNGRSARTLSTLILYRSGFDLKDFFALDDYYNENRQAYYAALQYVDPETIDLTGWLEYFVEGVAVQICKIKEKIQILNQDQIRFSKHGQLRLNERQWNFLEFLKVQNNASVKEYLTLPDNSKISERTAREDLEFLVKGKLVKRVGKGPATSYKLAI